MTDKYDTLKEEYNVGQNKNKNKKDVIDQLLDQIDFHGMTAEELAGENGLLKKLTSRFYSKALDAEMDEHLGYKKNDNAGDNSGNSRNGYTSKTVITDDNDTIEVQVPRDESRSSCAAYGSSPPRRDGIAVSKQGRQAMPLSTAMTDRRVTPCILLCLLCASRKSGVINNFLSCKRAKRVCARRIAPCESLIVQVRYISAII